MCTVNKCINVESALSLDALYFQDAYRKIIISIHLGGIRETDPIEKTSQLPYRSLIFERIGLF